jgi:hypothetical protein
MLRISGKAGAVGIVARTARKNRALLSGTALTAFVAAGMFSPMSVEQAMAACTQTTSAGQVTSFNCTADDNNGYSVGTFTNIGGVQTPNPSLTGINANINTSGMAAGASITNVPGSPALAIVRGSTGFDVTNGSDWTFNATDPFNSMTSTNAHTVQFGTLIPGSVINFGYAGIITATNGNAINGVSLLGSTVNITLADTAVINATGTSDLAGDFAGVPLTGGGVVLGNLSGSVDWTVTNHGTFHTQNDSIFMVNLGSGSHTINNDGFLGTSIAPGGGSAAVILAPLSNSANGKIDNTGGEMWVAGGGGPLGAFGAAAVIVGGNAEVVNAPDADDNGGIIHTVNGPGILAVGGVLGGSGTATVSGANGEYGSVTSVNGPGIIAASLGTGATTIDAGEVNAGAGSFLVDGLPISGGVIGYSNAGGTTVNAHGDISVASGGVFGAAAISMGGAATVNAQGIKVDPPLIGLSAIVVGGTMDATVNGQNSTVDADIVGMLAFNSGTGDAIVNAQGADIGLNPAPNPTPVGIVGLTTGGGDVDINGDADTNVNATYAGIVGYASDVGGNVFIDSGTTNVTNGVGVIGVAEAGAVDIHTYGDTTVGGTFGLLAVGGFASGDVDIDLHGRTVSNTTGAGVVGVSFDQGDVDIEAEGSTVDANALAGIFGLAAEGNVYIDAGTTTVTNGSGVIGVALDGNVDIDLHRDSRDPSDPAYDPTIGNITANGLVGVAGVASGNVDIDLDERTISNTAGAGVIGVSFDEGDVDIEGEGSTVNAQTLVGVLGLATDGNVYIDSGSTTVINGSGVVGVAIDGNVDIDTHGQTTAGGTLGLVGVGGFASGNVDIDLLGQTVTNTTGIGVAGVSFDQGNVDIEAEGSTIDSELTGILAVATDGNVYVDSGTITSQNGSGVIAFANNGNADVDTHGKISADNGLFGAAAFSVGGNATVTVGADIDPPLVGASAVTFGPGLAHADILDGVLVQADAVGVAGANFGTGNVLVDIGNDATIESGGVGILATKAFGAGGIEINVETGAEVVGDVSGVVILAGTPGATDNAAVLNNDGLIQGNGLLSPVIFALTDGGVTINNEANGVIRGEETEAGTLIGTTGDPLGAFEPAIVTVGGGALVNNDGEIHGSVAFLSGEDNTINNTGLWTTGGLNFLGFGGNDAVNNTGTVRTHLLTVFAGLEDFNNEGGLLTAQDDAINDVTVTTGNFNGRDLADPLAADSVLAFDATLRPLGTADLLVVGGNVTGATLVDVNDLDGGPGLFTGNDDAILFALVDGNTDTTNFYTNGGIDKGLFRYDAYLRDVPLGDPDFSEWVLASTLDREAYEFPVIGMGAQNLWHASTGTWLDRTADLRSAFGETGSGIVDPKNEGAVAAVAGNVTPGAWLKLFGGTAERDFSNTSAPTPGLLGPSYTYDSKWNQDHYGFMVGLDGGRESLTASGQNQAWLVGIMGGYTGSNLDFGNSETDVDYKVGSVGAYVTYLNGGFFADAALKADFGKIDYSSDLGGGFGDSFNTDFKSVGVTVDTGYRFNGATGWFFEPKATLSYVRTTYDNAVVLGTGVSIDDADSLRGRLGARLGTQMVSNGNIIEPWLEASAWHEFKGDYTATLTSNGFNLPVSYDVGGTFGEVAGGANFINVGNGWSGFAKGAVQFGDDSFLGFSGNLGVRKTW